MIAEGKASAVSPKQRLYFPGMLVQCSSATPKPNLSCHNSTATETIEENQLFSESCC